MRTLNNLIVMFMAMAGLFYAADNMHGYARAIVFGLIVGALRFYAGVTR